MEESWRRAGGVSEVSLGVFEGSEACVRTSEGGKATLGKASHRFRDRTGDVLGVLKTPPPGYNFIFRIPPEKPNSDETSGILRRLTIVEGMVMSQTRRMR